MKHGDWDGIRENEKFGKKLKRYFAFYKPDELTDVLKKAGFNILAVELTTKGEWVDVFATR